MLPLIFILLKWMFGKTRIAVCGTLLFAFDFMHFVQTRISTIDVYCVFFILCMYVGMYRYITSDLDAPFWKTAPPIILSGISFGLGAAAKWQSVYAGIGLLALFLIYQYRRFMHSRETEKPFVPFFFGTAGVCLLSFILVPGIVYVLCYIPYAIPQAPEGGYAGMSDLLRATWEEFKNNQSYMYRYHADLVAEHRYSARWYEWVFNSKPIVYYWKSVAEEGTRGSIWSFTNPLVTWAGLGAVIACAFMYIKRRSHIALFIVVGYLSQLVPWIPITRITFPYHYFPSMVFICLALAYLFDRMDERSPVAGKRHMIAFTAAALALFVMFYPVLTGIQMPEWYPRTFLQWFPANWPF
jgi:dolichyl-phosphate-mannose--protein O-mannosyl transferase